jgi:hypothetical protein
VIWLSVCCAFVFLFLSFLLLLFLLVPYMKVSFGTQVPKLNFPHQSFRGSCRPKPITRCHVALFDKISLIYAESNLHVVYLVFILLSFCQGENPYNKKQP